MSPEVHFLLLIVIFFSGEAGVCSPHKQCDMFGLWQGLIKGPELRKMYL